MTTTAASNDPRLATGAGRDEIRRELETGTYPADRAAWAAAEVDTIETAIERLEA